MQVTCPFCQGKITLMQGKQAVYGRCGCGASVFTAKGVKLDDLKPHDLQNAETPDANQRTRYLDDELFEKELNEPATPARGDSIAKMLGGLK